jgi:hypothetical protein
LRKLNGKHDLKQTKVCHHGRCSHSHTSRALALSSKLIKAYLDAQLKGLVVTKAQCWLLKLTVDGLSREGIFNAQYFSISMTIAAA